MVRGILPAGLSVLAGRPKIGKSWLTLAIAIGVASGSDVLGISVKPQGVLYLALEDNDPRLKKRLVQLLGTAEPPDQLHFYTSWSPFSEGGLAALEQWLATHPEVRLVVIDTLGRLRKASKPGGNVYQEDYAAIGAVKAVADMFSVGILCVSHVREPILRSVRDHHRHNRDHRRSPTPTWSWRERGVWLTRYCTSRVVMLRNRLWP